jgi:hypothetical protein
MDNHKPLFKPMTPNQLQKRCIKLFGRRWRGELAFNLGCTRQNIDNIMSGKHGVKQSTVTLIEAWETGKLKPQARMLGVAGRPFKKAPRP